MRELKKAELKKVFEMGALFMDPWDIAFELGVDVDEFELELMHNESIIYKQYWAGFIGAKMEIRKSELYSAKTGSVEAQEFLKGEITELEQKWRIRK